MKNKVLPLSLIVISLLGNNIYAADKTVQAIPSNSNIYVTNEDENKKAEGLAVYSIGGYNYIKLRDIVELLNFTCTWNEETNSVIIDNTKDNIVEDIDYSTIDDFANNYLDADIDKQIIDGYDCIYKRDSKDYTNITNYMRKYIDSNFVASDYIITEDTLTHLPYGYQKGINVLDIRLNVKGYYTKNFGYRIYIMDNIAKIITTIGSKNDDFDITKLKVPNITDEELIDMAVKADHNSYEVSETKIEKFFDMDDLKFKGDVEVTYIDAKGCYFATLNTFELE